MKKSAPNDLPWISNPANAALAEAGISSLADVAQRTEKAVAGLHGMGPKGIRLLKEALEAKGMAFQADD